MSSDTRAPDIPLFEGLDQAGRASLFGISERRACRDGEVIIAEGDEGDALFVVLSGAVQVEKTTLDRRQEALLTLRAGECFGELTLVDHRPRSATVRALGETEVAVFRRDALERAFARRPRVHLKVLENLIRIMSGRLRRVDENLIQSIYDCVIVVDRDLRVLEWNRTPSRWGPASARQAPADEGVGRDLFALLPHFEEGLRGPLEGVLRGGEGVRFQMECEDPVGGRIYIDTVVAPYRRGDGILGAVVAGRDVTDVKALEHQLIQSEKLAVAGQMAADIGHELNNYLSIISGHAEILGASPEIQGIPDALKSVLAIGEQVGRIERFTSGLMDFSAQNTRKRLTDLNGLIVGLIRFLQPQHRYRNVEFVLRLEEGLPRAEVDDGQIQQVLLNLYANAADAVGTGRVTTSTAFRRDEGKLVVAVSDDGPGIPPEILDRIFESGFTTKREGHGFGLSICRRIAANHAGDLTLRSGVGSGTTFTLTLPVGRPE